MQVFTDLECACVPLEELGPDCCDVEWEEEEDYQNLSDAFKAELDLDCDETVAYSVIADCGNSYLEPDPCADAASGFPVSHFADLILYLDDLNSYVEITTPLDNQTFALSGGGSAKTGSPDGFLTALVWAEDDELGNYDWSNWKCG